MAFGDGLSRFSSMSIALIILTSFLLMPSPVHSSRSLLAAGNRDRASAQVMQKDVTFFNSPILKAEIHQSYMIKRVGKGASSLVADEESERQVPTGPDPLHHNSKPATRP
ncbi:CLAVATA3/ESR (CLE)-like protein [Salix purpurea]|uniref:CLAVATA3/ESR (CLE)-like protein n=1 Tax=Salix purpurea TaxID=77065 RepID=A0A9Q0YX60_SALPP|nr:CLAVATA3/ESR (CLE)-like protein [Salix purpurea]